MTYRRPWFLAASAFALITLAVMPVTSQANNQAEERDRIDLGRLAGGPAIVGGGVILGEPTGLSAKLWFTESGFGFDAAVAWSFQEESTLYLHANALFHLAVIETDGGRYLAPYVGLGVNNRYGNDARLGLRLPVGLSILPIRDFPLEFFAELAPGVGLLPETDAEFGAGLGARFYVPL
jgi:hypothetical protein